MSKLVWRKTQRNPFFIQEFLKSLSTETLLEYNRKEGKCNWNLEKIQTRNITDNVIELISDIPGFDLINLSEDIYYSRSVIASAITAHEVGHVYQPEPLKKLSSLLRQSPIIYYSPAREFPILIPLFLKGISQ